MIPAKIGRYEILGQLATGGMAEILLGRVRGPSGFRRAVVIKRILRPYARNAAYLTMFLDEARVVASIQHPNVVHVQDLGEQDGEPFLVMEYVSGENASGLLKRLAAMGEQLEPALAAHVVAEACAGLHAAHELTRADGTTLNLVHRDMSPHNLLIAYDGHVKVLDFGVALSEDRVARTEVGELKGKLEYMSPEQVRGEALDRRADIFSLGVVLYELSTGRRLFQRRGTAKTIEALCTEPIVPPSRLVDGYPRRLEDICMRALARDRNERYSTAAEMRRDLLEVVRAIAAPTEGLAAQMRRAFADRIASKDELLRRVGGGLQIKEIPADEADEDVRIPNVTEVTHKTTLMPRPRPRRFLAVVIGALGASAIALGVLGFRERARNAHAPAPIAGAELRAGAPNAPQRQVNVRIETKPSGARIAIAGEERGETPLDVRLDAGGAPLALDIRRSGYRTLAQSLVPDRDQRLYLTLQALTAPVARPAVKSPASAHTPGAGHAAPPEPAPPPTTPPPAPPPAPSGFRRFD